MSADLDAVVVSLEYRLNNLAYLAIPGCKHAAQANYYEWTGPKSCEQLNASASADTVVGLASRGAPESKTKCLYKAHV